MSEILRIPVTHPDWRCENGEPLIPAELRPVVDIVGGRVFGVKKDGAAILVKGYESYRTRCARDLALFLWNQSSDWPELEEKVVSCRGAFCCDEAMPATEFSSRWRLISIDNGVVEARLTIPDAGDDLALEIGDNHIIYDSPYPEGTEDNEVDTLIACIERFGEPYNIHTGAVNPAYSRIYQTHPK